MFCKDVKVELRGRRPSRTRDYRGTSSPQLSIQSLNQIDVRCQPTDCQPAEARLLDCLLLLLDMHRVTTQAWTVFLQTQFLST